MTARECPEELLHALADGELATDQINKVQAHLLGCQACTRRLQDIRALKSQLNKRGRVAVPAGFEERLRFTLAGAEAITDTGRVSPLQRLLRYRKQVAALVAMAGLSALVTGFLMQYHSERNTLEQALIDAHLRAVTVGQEVQIASNDSHNVRPWFTGRLDIAPEAPDLSARGFVLVGGRLDVVAGQRTGVLVYARRNHRIDVFARPTTGPSSGIGSAESARGFNMVAWDMRGVRYSAISDLDARELQDLAHLFIGQ